MQVLEENQEMEYKRLIESGEWFDHPNKPFLKKEESKHEEPIRQRSRKRCSNGENSSK
jgi:hypothetical protein